MDNLKRRTFLTSLALVPAWASTSFASPVTRENNSAFSKKLKTSLNAFSFNAPLLAGTMTIDEMLDFCAELGFEGVDITGYYFKGYPQVPPDEYLYHVKRKAFRLGIEISGTGVRNDFTLADESKRQGEVQLVKNWIDVAVKIGAPVIRIFAGTQKNEGIAREKVLEWMLRDIRTCVDYGKKNGVVIGLQNHNDFIQTAQQVNEIIETVNSEWLGLILDTGSYRVNDPYSEISSSIKHAVNWQIKENVFINGKEAETDLKKLMTIINTSGYAGYLPIETLGEGDPKVKIKILFEKLKGVMG